MESMQQVQSTERGYYSPLERFIPSYSKEIISKWVKVNVPPGGWIFDPFCSNPLLAFDTAKEGYRVFTCCNNPIVKIILQAIAFALPLNRIKEVLEMLGNEKRGDESIKDFILSLYKTSCPSCHSETIVSRYIWTRDPHTPVRKVLFCKTCDANREVETDGNDRGIIADISRQPLPSTWALSRLGMTLGYNNAALRDALNLYTSRALLILFTLINRVEAMRVDSRTQCILRAFIVCACDGGSGFWLEDGGTPSLKQLIKPAFFLEHNIWQYLENSVEKLAGSGNQVLISDYPEITQRSGICIFNGKARSALPLPEAMRIRSIVMQLPRINPVFFILSGLWTGWIFGKEKINMMQGVFQHRDYDWQWQSKALALTFNMLSRFLPGTPCIAQDAEGTNGSLLADALAAQSAGWRMDWLSQEIGKSGIYLELKKHGIEPVVHWLENQDELAEVLINSLSGTGMRFSYDELFGRLICIASNSARYFIQSENVPINLLPNFQAFLNKILETSSRFEIENPSSQFHERMWRKI